MRTANAYEATLAAQDYYATEQASAQAFNSEVVQIEQQRKQTLEQQRLASERQAQIDAQQQQKAERQELRARPTNGALRRDARIIRDIFELACRVCVLRLANCENEFDNGDVSTAR
jgi:hypothetical protein